MLSSKCRLEVVQLIDRRRPGIHPDVLVFVSVQCLTVTLVMGCSPWNFPRFPQASYADAEAACHARNIHLLASVAEGDEVAPSLDIGIGNLDPSQPAYVDPVGIVWNIGWWWKDLGLEKELKFARDQPLKWYVWEAGIITDPSLSAERVGLTKMISLIYVIDTTPSTYYRDTQRRMTLFGTGRSMF